MLFNITHNLKYEESKKKLKSFCIIRFLKNSKKIWLVTALAHFINPKITLKILTQTAGIKLKTS